MAKIESHSYYEGPADNEKGARLLDIHIKVDCYAEVTYILELIRSNYWQSDLMPKPTEPVLSNEEVAANRAAFQQPEIVPAPKTDLQVAPVPTPTEPPRIVWAPPTVPTEPVPEKVHVSPEVERQDLIDSVVFLFEEDCKGIKNIESAVKVWRDHAGAIKKLQEPDKLKCSNTIALRLAEVLGVEPMEAKEVLKAALTKKSEPLKESTISVPKAIQPSPVNVVLLPRAEARGTLERALPAVEAPAAPPEPETAIAPVPTAASVSEAVDGVLGALASEPKPLLGLAVKHACTQLKTDQGVHAKMVEELLVSMIGKHPVLEVSPEDIHKITRGAAMKLYAGAAKTKLL